MKRTTEISPRRKARIAGVLYFISVLTAVFAEFFAPGKLGVAAITVPISCFVAVTLIFYSIFKPVNKTMVLAAVFFNLID